MPRRARREEPLGAAGASSDAGAPLAAVLPPATAAPPALPAACEPTASSSCSVFHWAISARSCGALARRTPIACSASAADGFTLTSAIARWSGNTLTGARRRRTASSCRHALMRSKRSSCASAFASLPVDRQPAIRFVYARIARVTGRSASSVYGLSSSGGTSPGSMPRAVSAASTCLRRVSALAASTSSSLRIELGTGSISGTPLGPRRKADPLAETL